MPARQTADSAHQNAYRGGVLSGSHWAERILANDQLLSPPTSSPGADSPYLTSNQLAYPAKDRYGVKLNRVDLDKTYACVSREELLCHHEADGSSVTTFLPLSPLAYGTKQTGEPPVQQYLWQARKKHDFKVPVKQISAGPDTITNISAAGVPTGKLIPKQIPAANPHDGSAANGESMAVYPRRGGEFSASLNKVHLKTGLRR